MKRIWIATLCLFGALQLSAQEPLKDWANFGKYEQEKQQLSNRSKSFSWVIPSRKVGVQQTRTFSQRTIMREEALADKFLLKC